MKQRGLARAVRADDRVPLPAGDCRGSPEDDGSGPNRLWTSRSRIALSSWPGRGRLISSITHPTPLRAAAPRPEPEPAPASSSGRSPRHRALRWMVAPARVNVLPWEAPMVRKEHSSIGGRTHHHEELGPPAAHRAREAAIRPRREMGWCMRTSPAMPPGANVTIRMNRTPRRRARNSTGGYPALSRTIGWRPPPAPRTSHAPDIGHQQRIGRHSPRHGVERDVRR